MKRNILVFGTISGLIVSAFMAVSMAMMSSSGCEGNNSGNMVIGFASMAVAFSFVFVGVKNFRDKHNAGVVSFGQAFLLGFMISLIASTLYVITWAVEFHFFMPGFIDRFSAMQIKQLIENGAKGEELVKGIVGIETENYLYKHSPFFFAVYTYLEILPVGVLLSLVAAFVFKRKSAPAV